MTIKTVPISKIDMDLLNPRFTIAPDSQDAAMQLMMEVAGAHVRGLASDIVNKGAVNPTDPMIVIESDNRFIALEGNRRLCALRMLRRPKSAPPNHRRAFDRLSKRLTTSLDTVSVYVAESRDAANVWIPIKHGGLQNGAGTVGWSAMNKRTFAQRTQGKSSYTEALLEAMHFWYADDDDFLRKLDLVIHGDQLTNFERLMKGREGKKAIGTKYDKDGLHTKFDPTEIKPFLERILDSLLTKRQDGQPGWSRVWHNATDRRLWIEQQSDVLPDESKATAHYVKSGPSKAPSVASDSADSSDPVPPRATTPPSPSAAAPNPLAGKTLWTDGMVVHDGFPVGVHSLFHELGKLSPKETPNVIYDVLRSFTEKVIKSYAHLQGAPIQSDASKGKGHFVSFADSLLWLEEHCKGYPSLRRHQATLQSLRTSKRNFVVTAEALNAANHNELAVFSEADARDVWNKLRDPLSALLRLGPDDPTS